MRVVDKNLAPVFGVDSSSGRQAGVDFWHNSKIARLPQTAVRDLSLHRCERSVSLESWTRSRNIDVCYAQQVYWHPFFFFFKKKTDVSKSQLHLWGIEAAQMAIGNKSGRGMTETWVFCSLFVECRVVILQLAVLQSGAYFLDSFSILQSCVRWRKAREVYGPTWRENKGSRQRNRKNVQLPLPRLHRIDSESVASPGSSGKHQGSVQSLVQGHFRRQRSRFGKFFRHEIYWFWRLLETLLGRIDRNFKSSCERSACSSLFPSPSLQTCWKMTWTTCCCWGDDSGSLDFEILGRDTVNEHKVAGFRVVAILEGRGVSEVSQNSTEHWKGRWNVIVVSSW